MFTQLNQGQINEFLANGVLTRPAEGSTLVVIDITTGRGIPKDKATFVAFALPPDGNLESSRVSIARQTGNEPWQQSYVSLLAICKPEGEAQRYLERHVRVFGSSRADLLGTLMLAALTARIPVSSEP